MALNQIFLWKSIIKILSRIYLVCGIISLQNNLYDQYTLSDCPQSPSYS